MPLTPYMKKQVLDFICGGAAVTRPASRFIQFANTNPASDSAFDAPIRSRLSAQFAPASTGATGFATISSAVTIGSGALGGSTAGPTAACTLTGWNLYDSGIGGTRLAYGTLSVTFSLASGTDAVAISASALRITLT